MTEQTAKIKQAAENAKKAYFVGALELKEAKKTVQVFVDLYNEKGKKIYGKKFIPINAMQFLRK